MTKITDFLSTTHSKEDLAITLEVVRAFKACESNDEWYIVPFAAWVKLEQFQEFLEHLVEGKPLNEDTLAYMQQEAT